MPRYYNPYRNRDRAKPTTTTKPYTPKKYSPTAATQGLGKTTTSKYIPASLNPQRPQGYSPPNPFTYPGMVLNYLRNPLGSMPRSTAVAQIAAPTFVNPLGPTIAATRNPGRQGAGSRPYNYYQTGNMAQNVQASQPRGPYDIYPGGSYSYLTLPGSTFPWLQGPPVPQYPAAEVLPVTGGYYGYPSGGGYGGGYGGYGGGGGGYPSYSQNYRSTPLGAPNVGLGRANQQFGVSPTPMPYSRYSHRRVSWNI